MASTVDPRWLGAMLAIVQIAGCGDGNRDRVEPDPPGQLDRPASEAPIFDSRLVGLWDDGRTVNGLTDERYVSISGKFEWVNWDYVGDERALGPNCYIVGVPEIPVSLGGERYAFRASSGDLFPFSASVVEGTLRLSAPDLLDNDDDGDTEEELVRKLDRVVGLSTADFLPCGDSG